VICFQPYQHLCSNLFQIVLDSDVHPLELVTAIGTSVLLEGVIDKAQTEGKYIIELKVDKVLHVGPVNPVKYPLTKPRLSLEAIRVHPHFRARTTTVKFH
jgi:asparaginyl-tRNA synthetase